MEASDDDLMAARSSGIGLDSLISVDIRSWFLKNFEVGIPVLKIMGNDTMADIAELVASQVSPSLLSSDATVEAPPQKETPPAPKAVTSEEEKDPSAVTSLGTSAVNSTGYTTPVSELEEVGPVKINWATEIALPQAVEMLNTNVPESQPRVVVLTGVSGLLGRALLSLLLKFSSVAKVICIATRRLGERLKNGELPQDERVTYYEGDLEDPHLGLSESDAVKIFSIADAVIHNGADTSHLKFYPAIRTANVESTRYIISLCMARKIPIHYLSTVGVSLFGDYESFPEIPVAAQYFPPVDGSHGYIASKWASERLLESLQKQYGINTWIHRPSTIIRSGADAASAAAQVDWMNSFVEYMLKTKAVPAMKNLRGALDFVSIENAAGSIVQCVLDNKPKTVGESSYVHQVGDMVVPLNNLAEFVAAKLGETGVTSFEQIQVLPIDTWAGRAVSMGLNRGVAALIESMDDPDQPSYPRMLRGGL
jgi:thioester reductase-like protein